MEAGLLRNNPVFFVVMGKKIPGVLLSFFFLFK